ncbi:MAG: preprotein translocase subunit YajC [Acidimicrobiales bacterium]
MAQLWFPLLLIAVMYFVVIAPQRKRQRAQQQLLSSLAEGDEIVTAGGIYGVITEVDGDHLYLEIAPQVEIRIRRGAVLEKVSAADAPPAGSDPGADDADPADAAPEATNEAMKKDGEAN